MINNASNKGLETATLAVSNLVFLSNTILSWFFFISLIIYLYFLIPAKIAQICNHTEELVLPKETQTKETNAETETQTVTVASKRSKSSTYNLNISMSFYTFHLLSHYILFLLKDNFLLHLCF